MFAQSSTTKPKFPLYRIFFILSSSHEYDASPPRGGTMAPEVPLPPFVQKTTARESTKAWPRYWDDGWHFGKSLDRACCLAATRPGSVRFFFPCWACGCLGIIEKTTTTRDPLCLSSFPPLSSSYQALLRAFEIPLRCNSLFPPPVPPRGMVIV